MRLMSWLPRSRSNVFLTSRGTSSYFTHSSRSRLSAARANDGAIPATPMVIAAESSQALVFLRFITPPGVKGSPLPATDPEPVARGGFVPQRAHRLREFGRELS